MIQSRKRKHAFDLILIFMDRQIFEGSILVIPAAADEKRTSESGSDCYGFGLGFL